MNFARLSLQSCGFFRLCSGSARLWLVWQGMARLVSGCNVWVVICKGCGFVI